MKTKGKIVILSGPSGSGKTTLYRKLLANYSSLVKSISVTTRPRRKGETHGRDYFFVSTKMFLYKKRAGHFLESQKVFDNYYGTPKKNVKDLMNEGNNVLLCIDVKGANVVGNRFSKATKIFVKTPSLISLRERLEIRGTESKETINLRLRRAKEELEQASEYDYVVVNDNLEEAFAKLSKIIEKTL